MKITLIGGSGFVGTRLIDLLSQSTFELSNIDKRQSHFFPEITVIGDVENLEDLKGNLKGTDVVVLLAAEHRDDVTPITKYYDVNVTGIQNTLAAMAMNGVKHALFNSSVAVYGLNKKNPNEDYPKDPFNHYGKSKWLAEMELEKWYQMHPDWNVNILRPTVIFGERNRGNVYNLLKQIAGGKFVMVGKGENKKSMAYVGNIVAFIQFLIENKREGYNVFNYIDKPDFTMNELVSQVSKVLNKHIPARHFPYWLGMSGGYCFDLLAWISRKKLTVSSVRVKKFCATTQFDASKVAASGFKAPYRLGEGLTRTLEFEFVHPQKDNIVFKSE
mgnify:FL=1